MSKNSPKLKSRYASFNCKNLNDISVHLLARDPFSIYTNFFPLLPLNSNQTIHIDVIEINDGLVFYKDFDSVILIGNNSELYIRKMSLSNNQIKYQAWKYLYQEFLRQVPVRVDIYYAIKEHIPKDVESYLFGRLSIEKVCADLNIQRHNFDYQAKKIIRLKEMPTFNALIDEVIHDQ